MTQLMIQDTWLDLTRKGEPKTVKVEMSDKLASLIEPFDYQSDGVTSFVPFELPDLPRDFTIGVIVGASGSGKSTLLKEFGEVDVHDWSSNAIGDHFETAKDAQEKFYAVGLSSVPTWLKPYYVLSNGEKFRADLARSLRDGAVIDEFTSVVDRNIAVAASKTFAKYAREHGLKRIVIASCHRDIIAYLQPDWIIDTDAGQFVTEPKECLRLPSMVAQVFEVERTAWKYFAPYHYLTAELSPVCRSFVAIIGDEPAAFYSVVSFPNGAFRNAFRGHRLVTHPDFQGLGLGPRLAEFVAQAYVSIGKRFFAKTAHPRLGEWRERSPKWRPTSTNKTYRKDAEKDQEVKQAKNSAFKNWTMNPNRFTYSHEYIGE